jgi:dTDP-4-dehydrorhamnose reductase
MRVTIIGTSGQLAIELRRRSASPGLTLMEPQKVDIADEAALSALLAQQKPQLVLNASAYTAVDRAETESEKAYDVNAKGPRLLAEWCSRHEAALIHVSTDYVFDGQKVGAYVEDDPTAPLGVYGASKQAGEDAIRKALSRHVILRTSWVFSAHGQNFVKTMLRLARERDELRVVADQHGRPTAAADLADAMLHVARLAKEGANHWGTYHFASAGETSWHRFAQEIVALQAQRTQRTPVVTAITTADYPTPAKRPSNSVLNTELFERVFGFGPRDWRAGLSEVVDDLTEPVRG